jgi:hypothetical protein
MFLVDHPCDDIDCNGNGNCTVTDGGATECQCEEGYKGDNCEGKQFCLVQSSEWLRQAWINP